MLSIGVRGGGQTYLPDAALGAYGAVQPRFGGTGTLDLRYSFCGFVTDRIGIGFTLGAGGGYATAAIQGSHVDNYTNYDYLGKQMDYIVSAEFSQTDRFARAEASLMASFRFADIVLNVGPRFMMPFAASSALTVTDANIDVYYPQYNVHVHNELITGRLETPYTSNQSPITNYQYSVLMAAELGYEWSFSPKSCLGLQAYADVAVWSKRGDGVPVTGYGEPLIRVYPVADSSLPVPDVAVNGTGSLTGNLRCLAFGIRLYYGFRVGSDRPKTIRHARDTRDHHTRYRWY